MIPSNRVMACPPGSILNPQTIRCVRATGKTAHNLAKQGDIPEYYAQKTVRHSVRKITMCKADQERNPITGRCRKTVKRNGFRNPKSEKPLATPKGYADIAPLVAKPWIYEWTRANCWNDRDPLTGIPFSSADTASLQSLVRLHNRSCVMAGPLHANVAAGHKAGVIPSVPGDPARQLTREDYNALRQSMRRYNPTYKIPRRRRYPGE